MYVRDRKELYSYDIETLKKAVKKQHGLNAFVYIVDVLLVFLSTFVFYNFGLKLNVLIFILIGIAIFATIFTGSSTTAEKVRIYKFYNKYKDCEIVMKKIDLNDVNDKYTITCLTGGVLGHKNEERSLINLNEVCRQNFNVAPTVGKLFDSMQVSTSENAVDVGIVRKGNKKIYLDFVSEEDNTKLKNRDKMENFTLDVSES